MQVFWSTKASRKVATISIASPGVVTSTAHGYVNGNRVVFFTDGALPTGIIAFKPYYVISATTNDFEIALTPGGTAINTTGTQSGIHHVAHELDLGATLGNCVVSAKYTKADMKADQFGETILDRRVKGIDVHVTTELAEIRNKNTWTLAFPNITRLLVGGDAVLWETKIGEKDTDLTGLLRLHPLSEDNTALSYDFIFFEAVASSESDITYGPSEQAKLKVVWTVLPDDSVVPARFFKHGDIEASL
jgi:hypothetical protein